LLGRRTDQFGPQIAQFRADCFWVLKECPLEYRRRSV
jgi:hypothetical protein